MTPEQSAAVAQLTATYSSQRADHETAARRWPGNDDAEFAAASARFDGRLEPDGELDAGWKRLFAAFGNQPPDEVVEAIRARFWEPCPAELDEFDAAVSAYDGRKGAA